MRWRSGSRVPPRARLRNAAPVLALEAGVVGQHLVDAVAGTGLPDHHTDRDTHAADTGPAAHDLGLLRDAIERRHNHLLIETCVRRTEVRRCRGDPAPDGRPCAPPGRRTARSRWRRARPIATDCSSAAARASGPWERRRPRLVGRRSAAPQGRGARPQGPSASTSSSQPSPSARRAVLEAARLSSGRAIYRCVFDLWMKVFAVAFGAGVVNMAGALESHRDEPDRAAVTTRSRARAGRSGAARPGSACIPRWAARAGG